MENKAVILIAEENDVTVYVCVPVVNNQDTSNNEQRFFIVFFSFHVVWFSFSLFSSAAETKTSLLVDLLQLKILTVLSVCLVLLQGMYKPFERFH